MRSEITDPGLRTPKFRKAELWAGASLGMHC
jgi:hypothetical protein